MQPLLHSQHLLECLSHSLKIHCVHVLPVGNPPSCLSCNSLHRHALSLNLSSTDLPASLLLPQLGPMLENAKFLLDIRAEKKSAEAEWIIIALICLEVAVNLYGHFML